MTPFRANRRAARLALLAALLAGPALARPATAQAPAPDWPLAGRSRVATGTRTMVVSGHPLASEVGRDIMRRGGNAIDAAVAVGFALQVTHAEAGNIGGGGFMVIRLADGSTHTIDYRETAPAAATRAMFLDSLGQVTDLGSTGHLAVGVPGSVAGMWAVHQRFGRLPWRQVVQPAVRLAREGFVIDAYRVRMIRGDSARLARFPGSAAVYLPGGRPPEAGTRFRQADLARTLTAIRDRGRDGFYRGWVADRFVAEMRAGGGLITHDDLRGYEPKWREPLTFTYRGRTLVGMGPVASGGVALATMLNIMEGWAPAPWGSALQLHREAEAMRRAFVDRSRWLGDPEAVAVPVARLTAKARADSLRATIGARASRTPAFGEEVREPEQTTHYSVVDGDGNAVSCTTTLENSFGSAVTVRGAGFLLNNEMGDFAPDPGRPNRGGVPEGEANAIAPGKRMVSSMTPVIVLDREGRLAMVLGTPGGRTITTQVFNVLLNLLDHGMTPADALAAPRRHHQAWPDRLQVEPGFAAAVLDSLRALGHRVEDRSPWGDVEAIVRTPTGWLGISDPRRGGGGAGDY